VLDGKLSPAYAEREYRVVVDPEAEAVDLERTAAARSPLEVSAGQSAGGR